MKYCVRFAFLVAIFLYISVGREVALARSHVQLFAQPTLGPTVSVQNSTTGKCLGILQFTTHGVESVSQYICDNSATQKWAFTTVHPHILVLINAHSKKCLSVAGGSSANGAAIIQYVCSYSDSQLWQQILISKNRFQLKNVSSSKCLDVANGSFDDGAAAILSVCSKSVYQNWTTSSMPGSAITQPKTV